MRETIDYSAERSWFAAGDHPIEVRERDRLSRCFDSGEQWSHYLRGRVDGKDAVWVLTAGRLVVACLGWRGRTVAVPYAQVAALEVEEGAHGWTLRVDHPAGRVAVVAVPPTLGRPFVSELEARTGKTVTFLQSRRAGTTSWFVSRSPSSAPPAARAVPAAPADHTATSVTAALREAADLHQRGILTDDEFAALKRKLLGG